MIKLFVTGDNHCGKNYGRYPHIKARLVASRLEALADMVQKAEAEACELFIITGDLFDNINRVPVSEVKRVAEILAGFTGTVLVLPGNHDYYTGDEKVWKDFEKALSTREHNVLLLTEFRPYPLEAGGEKIMIYPAFCHAKHSGENNLGWIKAADIAHEGTIHIGLAHGALQSITPDINGEYFLMSERELNAIPMDLWLLGHTHIPYPRDLQEAADTPGCRIFNPGTHEQTDYSNNTEGCGFIISVEKQGQKARVLARKYVSGRVHFYDLPLSLKPDSETALRTGITQALSGKEKNAVVRLWISGSVQPGEYQEKDKIYKELLQDYLTYEIEDRELSEEITMEKIRDEFAQTSFAARFMEALMDSPTELQMAYRLLQDCRDA